MALVLVVFALLLTVAALGWWLGSRRDGHRHGPRWRAGTPAAERTLKRRGSPTWAWRHPEPRGAEGAGRVHQSRRAATVRGIEQVNTSVSSGPAQVDVPALTGISRRRRGGHERRGSRSRRGHPGVSTRPAGTVLSSPRGGQPRGRGNAMSLAVAAQTPGPVPNVVGKDATARTTLEERAAP
ncbi:hypothetical protein QJS66_05680 [Kocuria rhizophila]|nr:hypothetical protein QJS66_05680 [Kocuria rhizophila]